MAFAETTKVPFERSISEIVSMVRNAGADRIGQMDTITHFTFQFTLGNRMVRFTIPMPTVDEMPVKDGRNSTLTKAQREARLDQARRQRGRALMLVIKAKLESVESGIETFEQAFLANVVMLDGQTVHERIHERLAIEYSTGNKQFDLLPAPGDK